MKKLILILSLIYLSTYSQDKQEKLDSTLDAKEVAAWTQVSSTVLASDPVILLY